MSRRVTIAYSPDTDDAFMVYALKEGKITHEAFRFEFFSADIQKLNESALSEIYDITAISVAAYPDISETYALMPIGASVGENFGPALVVRADAPIQSWRDLAGKKIAIPGSKTSAFFAASALLGPFEPVALPFTDIAKSVARRDVDAGILIHELQIDFTSLGLRKLTDLGTLWFERYQLPLPLGANAIRRSLGKSVMSQLTQLYKQSIVWGLQHREEVLAAASSRAIHSLSPDLADRYINMYVNHHSLDFGTDVLAATRILCKEGAERGYCQAVADFDFS